MGFILCAGRDGGAKKPSMLGIATKGCITEGDGLTDVGSVSMLAAHAIFCFARDVLWTHADGQELCYNSTDVRKATERPMGCVRAAQQRIYPSVAVLHNESAG